MLLAGLFARQIASCLLENSDIPSLTRPFLQQPQTGPLSTVSFLRELNQKRDKQRKKGVRTRIHRNETTTNPQYIHFLHNVHVMVFLVLGPRSGSFEDGVFFFFGVPPCCLRRASAALARSARICARSASLKEDDMHEF